MGLNFRSAPDMLQPLMPCCLWDQIGANSRENLEMCIVWTTVYRSAFMGSQNLKTWPKGPQITITLKLDCFCSHQLYPKSKWEPTACLNFQSNYWKSDLPTMIITGSVFLLKVFGSVMLHSLGTRGVFIFLLMKRYLQSCTFLFIFFVLLQYPAVA